VQVGSLTCIFAEPLSVPKWDGSSVAVHLWPFHVSLCLLTAESDGVFGEGKALLCRSWQCGPCGEAVLGFGCGLRTCPGSCSVPGSLRVAAVLPAGLAPAPAAEPSLGSSAEVLSSAPSCKCWADAQPGMRLSASPGCSPACAAAEEQGRGGLGERSCSLAAFSMLCTSWHWGDGEALNAALRSRS